MSYTKESVPEETLKELLETYWTDFEKIPQPNIIIKNDSTDPFSRVDLHTGDYLVIKSESPEEVRYRGNITYYDRIYQLTMEFRTMQDRQRIRDAWYVVKAIVFTNKHNFSGYQLIRIHSYQESVETELNIWRFIVRLQVEAHGVLAESI